ncbi:ER lumen protein retaining receptor-domain-containing protein [Durotheca rogersii]|uniref:ER lumen protein retaining receptor-domain-containing protein n=1 Tax=Durotheca rogersii TaxID=419775 RepID=UPI00221EA85F|nr:ER lumen protein retaining receptor-domain-containing protein [Durotheca rogersii]KAI5864718.1 ER lumen protein retaining receptor-domain-containing protein [Durotheca rogersii]
MGAFNYFRILGDCSHLLSKCILIFAIHRNRSAEGVSMITQVFYAVVFCTRYTDFFSETSSWNYFFKLFYILSSFYIIGVMRWLVPRTREREVSWKLGAAVLMGSLFISPFVMLIFDSKERWGFITWMYDFSLILESVCVLPQLLLLRQTTVPTVIDSFYLLTLGSYRALYILNWIQRGLDVNDRKPNAVSVIFGIVQTALYVDFFWVYYTRQRVKLRAGGIVDADDIRRGWLLNRIFGHRRFQPVEGDEESTPALGDGNGNGSASSQRRSKWGARGISISADDGVHEQEAQRGPSDDFTDAAAVDPDARMRDPDELARALDDDDDDDDSDEGLQAPTGKSPHTESNNKAPSGVSNGSEWRDN